MPRIALIGGGFSAVLSAAQLVRQWVAHYTGRAPSTTALTIELIAPEAENPLGRGAAYGTPYPYHLLNVRAFGMSAFPEAPEDFVSWLSAQPTSPQNIQQHARQQATVIRDQFIPRKIYGDYIADIWQRTVAQAAAHGITLRHHHAEVRHMQVQHGQWQLQCTNGQTLPADIAVLATGNGPPAPPPGDGFAAHPAYLNNLWDHTGREAWAARLAARPENARHVVIIGTGLTAVDGMMWLSREGLAKQITAISRHAFLPAAHPPAPLPPQLYAREILPTRPAALLHFLRREAHTQPWYAVIDGLRPHTSAIWQSFNEQDKQRFLRRLATWWNVRRHRMAPEIAKEVAALEQRGTLTIHPRRVLSVHAQGEQLVLELRQPNGQRETLHCDGLINTMGLDTRITHSTNPLLRQLSQEGVLQPGPCGLGVHCTAEGRIATAPATLYALGTLQLGEKWESVAVPELRGQCFTVAQEIVNGAS